MKKNNKHDISKCSTLGKSRTISNSLTNKSKFIYTALFAGTLALGLNGCGLMKIQKTAPPPIQAKSEQPTALMRAAADGDMERIRELIGLGASVNTQTPQGTALSWAIRNKQVNVAMYLLGIGAKPDLGTLPGQPSSLMDMSSAGETQMVKLLLAAGADVNYQDQQGNSALSKAAEQGNLTTVKVLLAAGANVNISPGGTPLLSHIVGNNDLLLTQALIAAGADVNSAGPGGHSPLSVAREKGFKDLEMLLVQSGAQ